MQWCSLHWEGSIWWDTSWSCWSQDATSTKPSGTTVSSTASGHISVLKDGPQQLNFRRHARKISAEFFRRIVWATWLKLWDDRQGDGLVCQPLGEFIAERNLSPLKELITKLCGLGKLLWPDFLQRFYSWLETRGVVEVADLRHRNKCLEMTGQALWFVTCVSHLPRVWASRHLFSEFYGRGWFTNAPACSQAFQERPGGHKFLGWKVSEKPCSSEHPVVYFWKKSFW